jgi:NAD(P)H-quinone oxidoreductase subunit 5
MTRISIKVRLAWSTCSQMGFMLMECGLGLYELALLHLIAHSLYKAHAFLYAGESVATLRSQTLGKAWVTLPDMRRVSAALVAAGLSVAAFYWAWTQLLAGFHVPVVALAIIAIGLAPLLFGRGLSAVGMLAMALLLQAYFLWHELFASVLGPIPAPSALQEQLGVLVVALFIALYALQAWLRVHPGSALSRKVYPYAYGGFFLDERFTRLTFRIWPARATAPRSGL